MKRNNKKGFTLAELLIVVAIIAVLTAIAIPVFGTQLEKSRQATDLANIRSAYAEAMAEAISSNAAATSTSTYKVQNHHGKLDLIDLNVTGGLSSLNSSTTVTGTIKVSVDADGKLTQVCDGVTLGS